MAQLLHVRSAGKNNGRVILWEKHPSHPDGEIFISDREGEVFTVGRTAAVVSCISSGLILEVEAEAEGEEPSEEEEPKQTTRGRRTRKPAASQEKGGSATESSEG